MTVTMGMKMRMTPGRMQLSSYNRNPLGEEDSDVQEVRLLLNEGKVRQKANMSHIMQKPLREVVDTETNMIRCRILLTTIPLA